LLILTTYLTRGRLATEELTQAGTNVVYRALNDAGQTVYIGITNNLERRTAQQLAEKGIVIDPIPGLTGLSRLDARSVEQVLIERARASGEPLLNKINSIAPVNPIYQQAIERGTQILQ